MPFREVSGLESLLSVHQNCQQIHEHGAPDDPQTRFFEGYALSEALSPQSRPYKAAEIAVAAELGYLPSENHPEIGFWVSDFEAEGRFDLLTYVMSGNGGKLAWVLVTPEFKEQVSIADDELDSYHHEILGSDFDFTVPPDKPMSKPLYIPVDAITKVMV